MPKVRNVKSEQPVSNQLKEVVVPFGSITNSFVEVLNLAIIKSTTVLTISL